ncbi:MAG: hypothetical protein REI11_11130 [Patulibacter sp.]|nr:hypothetical protein [Patulibacter sp.]
MSLPPRRSSQRRVHRRGRAVALVIAFMAVVLPAPAMAEVPITEFAAGPIPASLHCDPNIKPSQMLTQAAARTDFCLAFYVASGNPATGDDLKSTVADTPQGFLATADTSPQCTPTQLAANACPAGAQIGSGEAILRVDFYGLTIPQTVNAKIWNMTHSPDEVASVAIDMAPEIAGLKLPHVTLQSRTILRPNPDVGLRTIIDGQPRTASLGALGTHPIAIDGFFLRFWGSKDDHPTMPQSFGLMGSDCSKDQTTRMVSTSYDGSQSIGTMSYRLTGCDKVPFGVKTSVTTSERRPDVPTALTVDLKVDQHSDPLVNGNMKSTTLTLPAGLALGAQVASGDGGLPLCTNAQFGWDQGTPSTCPIGSRVADITFISPLQANEFSGHAYVGEQPGPGALPQLFIEGGFGNTPDAPRVKLRTAMKVDDQGRITTTLDDLPQVLFSEFKMTFYGGDHAAISTPRQCGTTVGSIDSTPSSTGIAVHQDLPLTIDEDCIDPAAFTPTVTTTTSNAQAGARGVTTISTVRPDRQARITSVVATLPQGITSDLNGVDECTNDQMAANACPASSRIGTITGQSGVGPAPQTVTGDLYLRTRDAGAVAGVAIEVPVKFGGVDLGMLSMPARIDLDQNDLSLRFSASVPLTYKGLQLNLRSFVVALDRPGFAINPTNCSPLTSTSTLTSDAGTTSNATSTFQVSGCDKLAFDPSIAMAFSGNTGTNQKPGITVTVSLPPGGSNIKSTSVTMPAGIAADLKQASRGCTQAAWNAGTCGDGAVVGTVTARLAISPEVVTGTVSLVKVEGQALPGIGMQLQGRFAARILGTIGISSTAQLVTTFPSVPDQPISSLQLNLAGGANGALYSTAALCTGAPIVLKGSFVGQSGATIQRTATATGATCPQSAGAALGRVTGKAASKLKFSISAASGKKINALKFALPSGVSVAKAKVGKNGLIKGTKSVTLSGKRTLVVKLAKAGATNVAITLPKGTLAYTTKLRKAKSFKVAARLTYVGGGSAKLNLTVKR